MSPLISVVMPAFNQEPYIAQAIQSVLDQEDVELELLVVDDASTDKTYDIAQSFNDPRVKVFQNERNSGSCATMNVGVANMKGAYFAILDADDYYLPGKLKAQLDYLDQNSDVNAVFCMPKFVNEHNEEIEFARVEKGLFRGKGDRLTWTSHLFASGGFLLSASLFMRAEVFERTGPFDVRFFRQPDIEYHVRLVSREPIAILEDKLYAYRRVEGAAHNSNSSRPADVHRSLDFFSKFQGFLRITDTAEVLSMFPFLKSELPRIMDCQDEWDETTAHYLLAMSAFSTAWAPTHGFGLMLLADLLNDPVKEEKLARTVGFTTASYRKLLRQVEVFFAYKASLDA